VSLSCVLLFYRFNDSDYLLPLTNASETANEPDHQQDDENQAEHSTESIIAIPAIAKAAAAQQQNNQNDYEKRTHLSTSLILEGRF
jgi:hypothetical protein